MDLLNRAVIEMLFKQSLAIGEQLNKANTEEVQCALKLISPHPDQIIAKITGLNFGEYGDWISMLGKDIADYKITIVEAINMIEQEQQQNLTKKELTFINPIFPIE